VRVHVRRHHKLILSVMIVLLIVAGVLEVAQDQETIRIRSKNAAEDPLFPGYVSALLGTVATDGNHY